MSQLNISEPIMHVIFSAVDEGLTALKSAQNFVPFALLLTKGGVVLRRFPQAELAVALERAQTALSNADEDTLAYVLVYDGQIEINEKAVDALMLEAGERGKAEGWRFIQRYQSKTASTPLYPIGELAYLGNNENYLA